MPAVTAISIWLTVFAEFFSVHTNICKYLSMLFDTRWALIRMFV